MAPRPGALLGVLLTEESRTKATRIRRKGALPEVYLKCHLEALNQNCVAFSQPSHGIFRYLRVMLF